MLAALLACLAATAAAGDGNIGFWDSQRKGANMMNQVQTEAQLAAAEQLGLQFVRLAVDKWHAADRDFLIGNADAYQSLNQKDLARLNQVLDWADRHHIRIVLTMLSLPGDRWKQLNGNRDDPRLWQDRRYWDQAAAFWRDLARALRGRSTIVAYDIINEPHPEKGGGFDEDGTRDFAAWYARAKGTARDLNDLYAQVVAAIRTVDDETPIMLESGLYAAPDAFAYLRPLADDKVLYAFHMYEPYAWAAPSNKGRYRYPGAAPFAGRTAVWNRQRIADYLAAVGAWQAKNQVAANRIAGAEFGCFRRNPGCGDYLADVVSVLNSQRWHWAFYAFREDGWDGMDYEIGTEPLPWAYWQAVDAGKTPEPPRRDNKLFDVIRREFLPR